MDARQLENWADWEGGWYDLYRHGISEDEITDDRLLALWDDFAVRASELEKAETALDSYISEWKEVNPDPGED